MTAQKALIAGDCWLKPGGAAVHLESLLGDLPLGLFVVNVECSVPAGPGQKDRRALLPLDMGRLPELTLAENTVCVLANNHVTDYGPAGVLETVYRIRRAGFHPLGAGATLAEAREAVIVNLNGRRIGLLAYADTRSHVGALAATDCSPGVAPLVPEIVCGDLQDLSQKADDLWLFLHWGHEYLRYPEPEQRSLATKFSEAGASLIVGMHPHVLRGGERVRNTLVYYSVGNFVFPAIPLADGVLKRWDRENNTGIALSGTLRADGWHWGHLPFVISPNGEPKPASKHNREEILRKFRLLSQVLDDRYIRRYPRFRKREVVLHALRRLVTMGWKERLQLCGRMIRTAYLRVRERTLSTRASEAK